MGSFFGHLKFIGTLDNFEAERLRTLENLMGPFVDIIKFIGTLDTKFHKIPSITSPDIVFTNKQTDRQTNQQTDKLENITSLTEIIK